MKSLSANRCISFLSIIILGLLSSACGGGGSDGNSGSTTPATYTVSGTVSGLSGTGLVLQNNGGDDLSISADGSFSFATQITDGNAYAVTVRTQPSTPNQICTVSNGGGTLGGTAVSNVAVNCVNSYTISGSISGLTGSGLVLQNNNGDDLSIMADGVFNFTIQIADGADYSVTILTQPAGQHCVITNGSGSVSSAAVSNVAVQCTWTKLLGVPGSWTYGRSLTTDASGNIYVAGYTGGGLDGNTLTGSQDFFVTKYDSQGVKQYTRQLGVAGAWTYGRSIATDTSGNVYVAGYTNGGLDGNTLTGIQDFFVTKYNSLGVKQYTRQQGAIGAYTIGQSVATDASGNVYVAGYTNRGLDGNTKTGGYDFFVTKYDSLGVKQYTHQLGAAVADTYAYSVTTDTSGNVYVAGYTNGGLDGNIRTGTTDFFVTQYDSTGLKQYTQQLGVAGAGTTGNSVATDASGNVYVAGYTGGGLDGNTLTGVSDFFVTQYNSAGVKQYTRQLGATGKSAPGYSVATDLSGNLYIAGSTNGGLDGNTLMGTVDFFVTKYDSTGLKQYTQQLGVAGANTWGYSVATDAGGNVYAAGYTNGGLDGNPMMGTTDFFVTKYDSLGVKQ